MQVENAKTVSEWLSALGAELTAKRREIDAWSVEGNVASLRMLGTTLTLTGRSPDDSPAWATTRSAAWNIDGLDDAEEAIQPRLRSFLRVLERILDATDQGPTRRLQHAGATTSTTGNRRPTAAARAARVARLSRRRPTLEQELHWASYVGWRSLTSADLYPHTRALGTDVSAEAIDDGWRHTIARKRDGTAPTKLGLYVHIPFCAVECTFCFCGKTSKFGKGSVADYLETMSTNMRRLGTIFDSEPITSVYFGGGTPSILKAEQITQIFTQLYSAFHVPAGTQVIFEGNPDSLNPKKIEALATTGRVTRLTIGLQTLDPEAQRIAKRFNRPDQVEDAVAAARRFGIPHINVDLMAGLAGQSFESFQRDLEFVVGVGPESVHINAFRPQPWSIFTKSGGRLADTQLAERDRMTEWGRGYLASEGFGKADLGPIKTKDAANLQAYDLRRENSSLLGFGIPARSHSFGSHFYETAIHGDDVAGAIADDRRGVRRYRAVPASDDEERHRYLVHNLIHGFSLREFRALFGTTPADAMPEVWSLALELGLFEVVGDDEVRSGTRSRTDFLTSRALLYGDDVKERARSRWSDAYDPSVDYAAKVERMVGDLD